jgi:hypothetical protein
MCGLFCGLLFFSYNAQDVAPLKLTAFGGYTRGDLEMLGNVFLEFDVDGDKTITYDEFVKTANSQLHGKVVHYCTALYTACSIVINSTIYGLYAMK